MTSSIMEWGVGIENEVSFYYDKSELKTGKEITDNLGDLDDYVDRPTLRTDLLKPETLYKIYEYPDDFIYPKRILRYFDQNSITIPKNLEFLLIDYANHINLKYDNTFEILINALEGIHSDGTNIEAVNEFVTLNWKNRTISEYVKEIKLIKDIWKLSFEIYSGKKIKYPRIGSLFPILKKGKYYSDYTGSYHVNLSLPYELSNLQIQEQNYNKHSNKVNKMLQDTIWLNTSGLNELQTLEYYLDTENIKQTLVEIQNEIPTTKELNLNGEIDYYKEIVKEYNNIELKNLLSDSKLELKNLLFLITDYKDSLTIKVLVKFGGLIKKIDFKLEEELEFIQKIKEFMKENSIDKLTFFVEENDTIKYYTSRVLINKLSKLLLSEPSEFKEHLIPNITTLANDIIDFDLIEKIKNNIVDFIEIKYKNVFKDVNKYYNLEIKYKSGYHKLIKLWSLAIQWITPLILSAYSSGDPFAIGDDEKLSELSLRLFISGYSFINLTNIQDYNIPDSRDLLSYQPPSIIKDLAQETFNYSKTKYTGTEFRADPNKGFNFGFEFRIFDNFEIQHLEPLLELLFLIADNLKEQEIEEIKDNPFSNSILINETINILKEGWNTKISSEYKQLLNRNLFPKTPLSFPENINAYDLCNFIYSYLQRKFINNGQGIGEYSKFLIKRDFITTILLPNINKLSWEIPFKALIWNKDIKVTSGIRSSVEESRNKEELSQNLLNKLGKDYHGDIDDIVALLTD